MKDYLNNLKRIICHYKLSFLIKSGLKEIYRKIYSEKVLGSYSQSSEDLIVEKFLNYQKVGFYVDIGAYHPTRLSNTYRFYKKGWRGILIEANPDVIDKFKNVRPDDVIINAGLGTKNGKLKYYRFTVPALNTFSKVTTDNAKQAGHEILDVKKVEILGVNNFVNKYLNNNTVDFLSVDTEGFDDLILTNWPWNKFKPKIICVENLGSDKFLIDQGYKLIAKTKNNWIYKLISAN